MGCAARPGRVAYHRRVRIVFVAAECEPWAKTGGLGDVVDALARALGRIADGPGRPVEVYLPRYRSVPVPTDAVDAGPLEVPDPYAAGGRTTIRRLEVAADGYRLRLIDAPAAYDRPGFYDHPDDAWRFGLLGRASLEWLRADVAAGDEPPDVIHLHDWHACPIALFRDGPYAADPTVGRAALVLTLHNLAYHGWTPRESVRQLGLTAADGVLPRDADGVDLLRCGVERAELVNTVSPTYAEEARTPELGFGLDAILRARGDRFDGILNGLDPVVWDPATDTALAARYDRAMPGGKAACRADLLGRLAMDPDDRRPILGAIGRLDPQKGFDILVDATPALVADGVRVVAQATGDPAIAAGLRALEARHPGRVAFIERFDREMARRIYAGCDAILVPSRFEPSGLVQMIGMRYGSPPIAHATGGLVDSIVDATRSPGTGTGFLFDRPTGDALAAAVGRATAIRGDGDRPTWLAIRDRAMAADFGWEAGPAPAYLAHYRRAIALRRADRDRPRSATIG